MVPSTPTRDVLSGDFSYGIYELVIEFGCGRDVRHGCIELMFVVLPVCLLQVESSPKRYISHSNGSMLRAWYWFHHNLVAAPGNSVGSTDDVRVVSSTPSTAVQRAGKLGVVNQAQSLILCPVLYQFAVSVSRSIAPCELWLLMSPMITCCWSPTAVSGWWNEKRSPGGL